jgi:type IV pilus assembly protein PilA
VLETLRKRVDREDEGFTLIELMVVVLIIAILLAIAIPTFLGAQDRARDRGAQSDLRNALTAAKTIATDDEGQFTGITETSLSDAEGAISFASGTAGTTEPGTDTVLFSATDTELKLWTESASETHFGIAADSTGAVGFCKGDSVADSDCAVTDDDW